MDKEKRDHGKKGRGLSPQVIELGEETKKNLADWQQEPTPILTKLSLLSPLEKADYFSFLIRQPDERVISLLENFMGKKEELDLALADSLGRWVSPQATALLQRMASMPLTKEISKAIRRAIFRLQSRGLAVEGFSGRAAVYRLPQPAPSEGYLSQIDSSGTLMVSIAKTQIPQGVLAITAMINDSEGVLNFQGVETSRKNFQVYLAQFQEECIEGMIEARPEYCWALVVEASEVGQNKGKPSSAEFLKWKPLMGPVPPLPLKPLIYQYLNEEEIRDRPELLEQSPSLFMIPSFQSWFLDENEIQKYSRKIQESSTSLLILSPYQKETRIQEIYRQAVQELFDEPRRLLYRRRLEEMAYFLWKKGKQREAQLSLAAATGLAKESGLLYAHPFLLELVKRSLSGLKRDEEKKKERESSLIIRP